RVALGSTTQTAGGFTFYWPSWFSFDPSRADEARLVSYRALSVTRRKPAGDVALRALVQSRGGLSSLPLQDLLELFELFCERLRLSLQRALELLQRHRWRHEN